MSDYKTHDDGQGAAAHRHRVYVRCTRSSCWSTVQVIEVNVLLLLSTLANHELIIECLNSKSWNVHGMDHFDMLVSGCSLLMPGIPSDSVTISYFMWNCARKLFCFVDTWALST